MSKFKTEKEIRDIIEGGIYNCGLHGFVCDARDIDSIKAHETEFQHTVSGTGICQRCKSVEVSFKGLPKPKIGNVPGAFCDDCKRAIVAEINATGGIPQ